MADNNLQQSAVEGQKKAIQAQIDKLKMQLSSAETAGYGQGGQFAGQQIPANVMSATGQPSAPQNQFGASAGTTGGGQFATVMQTAIDRLNQINPLTNVRQMLIKHLYDSPLSESEMANLPPEYQKLAQSGDKQEMEMGIRLLNDSISGRMGTLDQSVKFLTDQYNTSQQNLETQKQDAIKNIFDYAKIIQAQGYDPNIAFSKLYTPEQLKNLGIQVPQLSNTQGNSDQKVITSPSGNMYDMSTYATDPQHAVSIQSILNSMGKLKNPQDITNFISQIQGSPITADMIQSASQKYGVGWEELLALMKQESQLGTQGAAVSTMNPGNVGNVDGGEKKTFSSWQEGVDAAAQQLANRKTTQQENGQYADILQGKTQDQQKFFNSLSPQEQSNVSQIIKGTALISDLAAGMGGAVARQRLLSEAQIIDPNFSENVNKRRYQFQTAWFNPNASPFKTRTSINTAMGHIAQLKKDADAIGNDTVQKYNTVKDMLSKEVGNDAVTNFNYTLTQVASEIASAYKNGTAPTDQEVEQERAALAYNFSPKQFQGVFDRASKLLSSKITSMSEEYKGAMGKYPDDPIVQDYALQEMKDAGIDTTPIESVLQKQGYGTTATATITGDSGTTDISKMSDEELNKIANGQ